MKRPNEHARRTFCLFIATITLGLCPQSTSLAIDFGTLVKKVGKVSDDLDLKHFDDFAQQPATVKAGRDVLERNGRRAGDALERARLLRKALLETLGDVDPAVVRQVGGLDEASQQAALVLSRGARNLEESIPDVALRSKFLQDGGGETLCTLGHYDDLMDDAIRFDTAIRAGNVKSPSVARSITLKEFGQFFYDNGDRAHHFWVTYVRPHWKLWLGGSALAAVMLAPDDYLDEAGNLTRDGLKKVTQFGGTLLGDAIGGLVEGVGEGTKQALKESGEAFVKTFFTSIWGIASLVLLAAIAVLAVPWMRRKMLGWLTSSAPKKAKAE